MHCLSFMIFLLCVAATFLNAAEREAIGYGSGDDLAQAVAVAEGDAVLNAGGKASFIAEVQKDKLLRDAKSPQAQMTEELEDNGTIEG